MGQDDFSTPKHVINWGRKLTGLLIIGLSILLIFLLYDVKGIGLVAGVLMVPGFMLIIH